MKSKNTNSVPPGGSKLKHLALALVIGAGSAHGQFTEVGGAGVIGDTVLTTVAGTATLPQFSDWRVVGANGQTVSTLISPTTAVTADGNVTLTFTHRYHFEPTYDGGAIYISVDGNPSTYVPLSAFSSNGYNGAGNPDPLSGSAWTGFDVFDDKSSGYDGSELITTVADLGLLTAGQTISVEFVGKWDGASLRGPVAWEIGSCQLKDGANVNIVNVDFNANGASGFTETSGNHSGGTGTPTPWGYTTVASISKFELDAAADTADRYAPDIAPAVIDLTGSVISVSLLNGTLLAGDTFSLFDLTGGTTLSGAPASVSLPGNIIWDTSNLATNGTITVAQLPASGTWITDGNGNWSDTTKWAGGPPGVVAFGTDNTADFTLNLTADRVVTLDSAFTIGNIIKDDTTDSTSALTKILTIGGSSSAATPTLTLDVTSGSPTITNNDTFSSGRLQINRPIAGNDGLTIAGGGIVILQRNESSYTGATSITGLLDFGGISNANIGGGTGRNITVASGSSVKFGALSNAFLNRLVETTDEIAVMTGATANSFDLSSSTGATLPGAFISTYATNGGKAELSGTITPAAGAYRLGSLAQSGALGIRQESLLSGANQLIVGGNRVVLVGAHTFTGDTTIRDGGRLGLAAFTGGTNSLALQNSALDLGTPASTASLFLEAGSTAGPIAGSNVSAPTTLGQGTISATLGGLKGSRNFAPIIAIGNTGNNTAGTLKQYISGFTLNPGTAVSCTYSGSIDDLVSGVSLAMAKTGDGTQEFSGSNSYTGTTTISGGTLKVSHANGLAFGGRVTTTTGATTVDSGATLDLNGTSGINEPIVLNGNGVGGNGALINNAGSPAGVSNGIAALTLPATGTGSAYTATAPTVTISGGGGSGATATASLGLTTASITSISSGGAGWAVNDTFHVNNSTTGYGAIFQVTGATAGVINSVSCIKAGAGFANVTGMTITRVSTASGSTLPTITWNSANFTVGALQLTAAGSGYTSAPTVTFSVGSASDGDVTKTLSSVVLASSSTIGGSGDTSIDGVVSESGGSQGLTKAGAGTLTLAGANSYTGATAVNEGTLALVGGSQTSAITVAGVASLGFTLGSPTTSTQTVTLVAGHAIAITGTVDNSSDYKLMTATSFSGVTPSAAAVANYELELQNSGTELWLVYTGGGGITYATWSGGASADGDENGDGVKNAVAYALNAADVNANAIGLLPTLNNTSDPTYFIFTYNRSDDAEADSTTAISVQYGNNLDGWTTAVDDNDNVEIEVTPGSPTDMVVVKLKRSTLGIGGKLFARLNVVVTP